MLKLFRTVSGLVLERDGVFHALPADEWDALITDDDPAVWVAGVVDTSPVVGADAVATEQLLPPIESQEV